MFKVKEILEESARAIEMRKLKPCQVAQINSAGNLFGEFVMRTASEDNFEVMSLSDPGVNCCWEGNPTIKVIPLLPGQEVTLVIAKD